MGKVGGPRVFFDVLGTFNAQRLLADSRAATTVLESVILDSVDSIVQSFAGIGQMIGNLTREVVPLGVALSEATLEFEKFAGRGTEALQESIMKTGVAFGLAADDSLRAGAKMAQLSALIGQESIDVATELGQKFALIGGMSTDEAMKGLINLQQQTKFMYGDMEEGAFRHLDAENQRATVLGNTMEVMDQLNTVENTSVATMKQLIFIMNQFAAQAHITGESIADMAAMSAVLVEAGEEQGKAGRALRMIYARLGSNIKDNNDLLKSHGVNTHDANGALRSLSDILEDINKIYPNLTEQQRQNLVQTVAGNDHYVRLVKLIENQSRVSELAAGAMQDQATAQEEVNLRTEDAAIAYKAALEQQKLIKAQLGQQLLPAMTAATERTNQFNVALAMVMGGNETLQRITAFVIRMQQYGQIFGTFMNAFMQMKSVNIAMATHQTILRAINGEEIVRTDSYRKQGLFSGITLDNQKFMGHLAKSIAIKEHEIGLTKEKVNALQEEGNVLREQETQILEKVKARQAELNAMKVTGMAPDQMAAQMKLNAFHYAYTQQLKIEQELQKTALGMVPYIMAATHGQTMNTESLIAAMKKEHVEKAILFARNEALLAQHDAQMLYSGRAQGNRKAEMRLTQEQVKELSAENTKIMEGQVLRQQRIAMFEAGLTAQQREAMELERAQQLYDENKFAVMELGLTLEDLRNHTIQMDAALEMLNQELAEGAVIQDIYHAQTLKNLYAERAQMEGRRVNTVEINRMNMAMTRFSMTLGMASMALGFLGDDQDSATASMVLMTASMVPAMVQMGAMTVQTMGMGAAAGGAAVQITGMTMAMSALKMVAFGGVLSVITVGLVKLFGGAKDAKDEVDDLNISLGTTQNLLSQLTEKEAQNLEVPVDLMAEFGENVDITTATFKELSDMITATEVAQKELAGFQAQYASDDPMFALYQDRINALDIFRKQAGQMRNMRIGAEVSAIEFDYPADEGKAQAAHIFALFEHDLQGHFNNNPIDVAAQIDLGTATDIARARGLGEYNIGDDPIMQALGAPSETHRYDPDSGFIRTKEFNEFMEEGITLADYAARVYGGDLQKAVDELGISYHDLTQETKAFYAQTYLGLEAAALGFSFAADNSSDLTETIGDGFSTAEEKMRSFANAREELFFGGKSSYMSGDMMKQVVNKGVENLYSNVELVMTNNFYGLTFEQAVSTISDSVVRQLIDSGVPMNETTA